MGIKEVPVQKHKYSFPYFQHVINYEINQQFKWWNIKLIKNKHAHIICIYVPTC